MSRWLRLVALALFAAMPRPAVGFSVLSHQAVIDETWKDTLVPALRQRFPGALDEKQLEQARAFAYGGSHAPDLGYFPFGNVFFTDLLHYVRSGDFVAALLAEAQTLDEYAFALGVLSHYVTDNTAHPQATNRVVPEVYPEMREKHGDSVTYADDHGSHIQTEFRFDVLRVAQSQHTPGLFEHALRFRVAKEVLERAFVRTYGLRLEDVFANTDAAILTYRWAFRDLIHTATGIAWELYRAEMDPSLEKEEFVYDMSKGDFEKEFGDDYQRPRFFSRFFGWFVNLVPDVGPFERAVYKPLPPPARRHYKEAMKNTLERFRAAVAQVRDKQPKLPNQTLDTGEPSRPGKYVLTDETYAELTRKLAKKNFERADPALKKDLLAFFDDEAGIRSLEDDDDRRRTRRAVAELRSSMAISGAAAAKH